MRRLVKLSYIIPIPIVIGLTLCLVGGFTKNSTLSYVGGWIMSAGVPLTMFFVVVIGLILMITGKLETDVDDDDDDETSTGEDDEDEDTQNNSTRMIRQASNAYKHSTPKEKILGWLFFGFLMTDFFLILVFAFFGLSIGVYICLGLFAGTIILSLLIKLLVEHISLSGRVDHSKPQTILHGTVKICIVSSTSSINGRTTRTVYRVLVSAEGNDYNTYTKTPYKEGDTVTILVRGKHRATIIDDEDEE